ncbi:acyltransferase [Pseudomonas sp. PDM16]|uniref:acyltransferase family protein n=1 Tax=Pseudomonas sp. PDM16 TaxID=2769292 RepID=UPI001780D87E|nr:acyltransferase [Pseudomonas sp. PDM16]MBD9416039.1 acyltransferase [Pseudomonas sp. PDM16]
MPKAPTSPADRLYALDALRGFAALSVVLWHWQHFFYKGSTPDSFDRERQPLFQFFSVFYTHGSLAVELFFGISGFVFFWLFSRRITDVSLSPRRFFVDRFSRLYPLHIATFALVAMLQFLYARNHASYFVYPANDLYHAVLNILLVPAWGLEKGWSFNAPIWSVSVEVFLYGVFFLLCLFGRGKLILIPLLIGLGAVLHSNLQFFKLGVGLFAFFCGGSAYLLLSRSFASLGARISLGISLASTIAAWGYACVAPEPERLILIGVVFPLTVATLAAIGFMYRGFLKPLAAVGDLSYSSYLLHFPLQLAFVLVADNLGYERTLFYSPWMLLLFMALLIPLSLASHRFFEVPIQRALRSMHSRHEGGSIRAG